MSPPSGTPHILVILGSTRQGRFGETVARWFLTQTEPRTDLTFEFVDLRDWPLRYYDRPTPAALSVYDDEAERWAAVVGRGDAYVIITPEYNHGYPAALKSALDAVYKEWNRKPVAFVSYGGWSGGVRAMQQLRQVVIELQMVPIRPSLVFQFAPRAFATDGTLIQPELFERGTGALLDDLSWWAHALQRERAATT